MIILQENEKAYKERYGVSLQSLANMVSGINVDGYDTLFALSSVFDEKKYIPGDVLLSVFIGLSDGEFFRRLFITSSPYMKFLIVEPDINIFLYACSLFDFSEIISNHRIEIVVGGNDHKKELVEALRRIAGISEIRHLYGVYHPEYKKLYPNMMGWVTSVVQETFMYTMAETNTSLLYGREIIRNRLYALAALQNSALAGQLFNAIPTRDIPVIIVGAGPSLEKNAHILREAKGKALIVACTRSTELLNKKGVFPDIVAMIDMLKDHDYCCHDIKQEYHMLLMAQSDMEVQKRYYGKCIYFGFPGKQFPLRCLAGEISDFPTGGSVVTCMFELFYRAGFKNIVLVGEDLAYSEEGKAHSGTFEDSEEFKQYYWDGYYGGKVRIREDWKIMLEFLEQQLKMHTDIVLTDSTEGGALIHGSVLKSLAEVVSEMEHYYPVDMWISNIGDRGTKEKEREEIRGFFELQIEQCEETKEKLLYVTELNKLIKTNMFDQEKADDLLICCEKYDQLLQEIMNYNKESIIRDYCTGILMEYDERVKYTTADEDLDKRLIFDADTFHKLYNSVEEIQGLLIQMMKG